MSRPPPGAGTGRFRGDGCRRGLRRASVLGQRRMGPSGSGSGGEPRGSMRSGVRAASTRRGGLGLGSARGSTVAASLGPHLGLGEGRDLGRDRRVDGRRVDGRLVRFDGIPGRRHSRAIGSSGTGAGRARRARAAARSPAGGRPCSWPRLGRRRPGSGLDLGELVADELRIFLRARSSGSPRRRPSPAGGRCCRRPARPCPSRRS